MKTLLHVGCGASRRENTTAGFAGPDWRELRLDINPAVNPDIVGTITSMTAVPDASVDAVFSSHNIEHLYPHEVPRALGEFLRVLKPEGFVIITCPDLQSVAALVAEDKLTDAAYTSPAGPITPLDMIYGYRPELAAGNLSMAHKNGFTAKVLGAALTNAGFKSLGVLRRHAPVFDLWAVASKNQISDGDMHGLIRTHLPA